MLRKLYVIPLMVFLFTVLFASAAYADTYNLNILDENYSFNTGNGADGDVVLRLKAGDPSRAELVVNGAVKTTITNTATIKKNILERNGEPLNQRSDVTVKVFNIENIVPYLPVNKTYSPSNDTPGSGSMPNFNNLTIESGVMLRAASQPLHFKVKGTLTVNGYMMTEHGAGGAAGNYPTYHGLPGASAKNIIILAGNVNISNGAAVFGGFGGGGGGAGWVANGGNGGNGGSITIYTGSNFSNGGEIHGGAGGGGGIARNDGEGSSCIGGQGGVGGNALVVANNFNNTGKIMSGLGGGAGTARSDGYDCGGYGAGGCYCYAGGSGGNPGGGEIGSPYRPPSGAGFGVEGTFSVEPLSNKHGLARILVSGSYANFGRFGVGYSSMQDAYGNVSSPPSYSRLYPVDSVKRLEVKTNQSLGNFNLGPVVTHFANGVTYSFPNANMVSIQDFNKSYFGIGVVAKNVLVKNSFTLTPPGSLRVGDRSITDTVTLEGPVFLNQAGDKYLRLNSRLLTKVPSLLYGTYNINDEWRIALSFNGSPIAASPDSTGMLNVDLTSYNNAYYSDRYAMGGSMTVVLLRSEDGGATWEELSPVDFAFANGATPKLVDLKTKVNTTTLYKVKYKKNGSPYGYLMHDVTVVGYTTAAPLAEAKEAAVNAKTAAEASADAAASARDVATEARNAVVDANGNVLTAARSANAQATAAADRTLYNGQSAAYWAYQAVQGGIDIMPPVIEKLRGKNGATATTTGTFEVEVTTRDDRVGQLQARAQVDGGIWTGWYNVPQNRVPVALSSAGAHTIIVEVKDAVSNVSRATITAFRL